MRKGEIDNCNSVCNEIQIKECKIQNKQKRLKKVRKIESKLFSADFQAVNVLDARNYFNFLAMFCPSKNLVVLKPNV